MSDKYLEAFKILSDEKKLLEMELEKKKVIELRCRRETFFCLQA